MFLFVAGVDAQAALARFGVVDCAEAASPSSQDRASRISSSSNPTADSFRVSWA